MEKVSALLAISLLDPTVSLDIQLPCSYEEDMELRGKKVAHLTQAAIKRVLIRHGCVQ